MIDEKIKSLRQARNWTQAELARQLGISRNGVNSWEQGFSMPSTMYLAELSKLFKVSSDFLLGIEQLSVINVSGLDQHDIALLTELASRLQNK